MARTRKDHGFTALRIEGGILPPEFLQSIAALEAPRQTVTAYSLSKSLVLKEELARYWRIANDLYTSYSERRPRRELSANQVGVGEWLVPLLRDIFGYDDLTASKSVALGERRFELTHRACSEQVPLLLTTRDFELDKADPRFGDEGRRQTPHGLMQEYLNAEDASLWGIIANGSKLRLLRDNSSLTRPACIEADLDLMFAEALYADFAALWLTVHASRLQPTNGQPSSCIIESWRAQAHQTGERALENLRDGVTEALRQLGNGFLQHPDNAALRAALDEGKLSPEGYFQQLLRFIYRLLFLFRAEERDLLHTPGATDQQRALFAEGYSLAQLRERALRRRHYDHHHDLYEGLRITFGALAQEGVPALGLSALGGLFRSDQCPDLEGATIANERLLEAVRNLAFFRTDEALARVNYRDMGTEELGSVYESLLELQPVVDVSAAPWGFGFVGDGLSSEKSRGSERKLTGSYYTPAALVNELIKSTLEPVLAQAVADHPENPREAILALRVIDPACGSGHFLLAAARRMAAEIARYESSSGEASGEAAHQQALRAVVQHCIYGVDRNPLAVELCKTALWIETVEPGRPLTFLDAHILHGDSLVGVLDPESMANGILAEAYKPLTGDDKAICTELKKRSRQAGDTVQGDLFDKDSLLEVAVATLDLDAMPEETIEDVERKRTAYEAIDRTQEELRANLFVGAYFAKKTQGSTDAVPLTEDFNRLDAGLVMRPGVCDAVGKLARQHCFFHWHLAFAEIMQDGGFDVVLGNPPWEVSQLAEEEYFALRAPSIANLSGASRKKAIKQLEEHNPTLWKQYQIDNRGYAARNAFCRGSVRYPLTAYGKLNSYALFAETFLRLLSPKGRVGLIVPTGIATDNSTKAFFDEIVSSERLVSLYDFENRESVFPGVHRSYKFCLLTLSGADRPSPQAEFAFFLYQAEQLRDPARRFTLSAADFALFNPNTRTCPIFRTRRDMEIARKMYGRAGVLWKEAKNGEPEVNPWGVTFMQMFNMTSRSGLFRTREELEEAGWQLVGNVFVRGDAEPECYLPLYEAKLFHQYDHRFATFDGVSAKDLKGGNARPMTAAEKADAQAVALPRYWVPEEEVQKRLDKTETAPFLTTEPSRAEPSRAEPSRAERSLRLPNWLATRSQENCQSNRRADGDLRHDAVLWSERFGNDNHRWLLVFRDIARATDWRTAIFAAIQGIAVSNKAPLLDIDYANWLQAFRGITNATNERTVLTGSLPLSGVGNSAPVIDYEKARGVASALVLANMNSLPLDWIARFSVGGVNMNFFIVKQLPVLPPEAYLEEALPGLRYVELIVPRVLELTYTAHDLEGFARDLGYDGPPFSYDDDRRHHLKCELDSIFAHLYQLDRTDLEWILDAPKPSASFPALKRNEMQEFGEYRTQRYVLQAYDQLARGELPDLTKDDEIDR